MSICPVSTVLFPKSGNAIKAGKPMYVVEEQADKLILTFDQHTLNGWEAEH